jgi:hypothetical protein
LEPLKNTIPLNELPYSQYLQFLRKNETIREVTDFRELNLLFKSNSFSIQKIELKDMISSIEGFALLPFCTLLNMGYHHIKLYADAQNLCTIAFPWNMGKYKYKYKYKRLPWASRLPGS